MIFLRTVRIVALLGIPAALLTAASPASHWVTSWTASAQGPYPIGNPSAQPNLSCVFPAPPAGARDQSFRLIVRLDIWGPQARLRLSNVFGTMPVTLDGVFVGLQMSGAALTPGTTGPVLFKGRTTTTINPDFSRASSSPVPNRS